MRVALLLGFLAFVALVVWLLLKWLTSRAATEYASDAARLKELASLPQGVAEERASRLLVADSVFESVSRPVKEELLPEALPRRLRRLMSEYEVITTKAGPDLRIGREFLGPSAIRKGFFAIGEGMPGSDTAFELAIRPGEESVYELYQGEDPDPVFGTYPTVYHWLVAVADESRESGKARSDTHQIER